MNEERSAELITSGALARNYKDVESFQAQRTTGARRNSVLFASVAAASIVTNIVLASTLLMLVPLTKLVPVYLWVRADGTVDSSVTMSRLPATQSDAVVTSAAWEYVRLREGYSYDSRKYGYDAVSGMSDDTVRAQYQNWFNYPSPASPMVTIGRRGQVDIEHISTARLSPNVLQIRYRRLLTLNEAKPIVTTWTATIQYRLIADLPASVRLRNPGGVVVTSYQAAEDSGQ